MNIQKTLIIITICIMPLFSAQGCSSLSRAASNGSLSTMKKFIEKGQDINQYDRWGMTPLIWATYYQQHHIVEYLISLNADVNKPALKKYRRIRKGRTPLIIAAFYGNNEDAKLLLDNGADPSVKDCYGKTALMYAEQFRFSEVGTFIKESLAADYTILLSDGSKVVGKIASRTDTTLTIATKYLTLTVQKDTIQKIRIKTNNELTKLDLK